MAIYFIQNERTKAVKIGYSGNVKGRIKTLRTASADRLRLLGTIAGGRADEHRLHVTFAKHRMNGEWLEPADEVIHSIQWMLASRGGAKPARRTTEPTVREACDLMELCNSAASYLLSSSCDLKYSVSLESTFDDEEWLSIGGTPEFFMTINVRDPDTGASGIAIVHPGDSFRAIQTRIAEMVADIASQNCDSFIHCVKV